MIHTIKSFSIVNEAEVDVFLELPCFLYDPMNVGSLISGSSAFSKPSLYIWKFLVHVLLKPRLKGFEIINKVEVDVFLELSCFFHDPADVGNLISGSSAFLKTEHLEVHGSRIAEAWLEEFWTLLY